METCVLTQEETNLRVIHNPSSSSPKLELIGGFINHPDRRQFNTSVKHEDTLIQETFVNGIVTKLRIWQISHPPPTTLINSPSYINTISGVEISTPVDPKWVFAFISHLPGIKFLKFGSTSFNEYIEYNQEELEMNCFNCPSLEELIINADPRRFQVKPVDVNLVISPSEFVQMVNKILALASNYCPNLTTASFILPASACLKQFLETMPVIESNGKTEFIHGAGFMKFNTFNKLTQPLPLPPQQQQPAVMKMRPPPTPTSQSHNRMNLIQVADLAVNSSPKEQSPQLPHDYLDSAMAKVAFDITTRAAAAVGQQRAYKRYNSLNSSDKSDSEDSKDEEHPITKKKKKQRRSLILPLYDEVSEEEGMVTDDDRRSVNSIFSSISSSGVSLSGGEKKTTGIPGLDLIYDDVSLESESTSKTQTTRNEEEGAMIDEEIEIILPRDVQELESMSPLPVSPVKSRSVNAAAGLKVNLAVPHAIIQTNSNVAADSKKSTIDYDTDFNSCFTRRK